MWYDIYVKRKEVNCQGHCAKIHIRHSKRHGLKLLYTPYKYVYI